METVVQPSAAVELHLLTEWAAPRRREAGFLSILFHVALILGLMLAPKSVLQPPPSSQRIVTPLIEPLTDLTQTDPNKGKINKEFEAAASQPRPRIQIPAGALSTTRPSLRPAPTAPVAAPAPVAPPPEPPRLEAPKPDLAALPPPAAPQILAEEKPKLAFENPSMAPAPQPGQGRPLPKATADEAIRNVIRNGGVGVGPDGAGPGGFGPGVNLPPSPGMQPNNMQLLSDPMGVDFRPYLTQVLSAVKRYWMAVWPESARLGRSGKVAIQFSIDKNGGVPKLVIATTSGVQSLDRAAVAAISGSIPFAPLPRNFKGDVIKLQLNFAYNMPKQ
jgi:TonB family protein